MLSRLRSVPARLANAGIRRQLWALFVIMVAVALAVLAMVERSQAESRDALLSLQADALDRLRNIEGVSDAYAMDVVGTGFRVESGRLGWNEAVEALDDARRRIDAHWAELEPLQRRRVHEQLFREAGRARAPADAAMVQLREILVARDVEALDRFTDERLYPAIDPATRALRALSDRALIEADYKVQRHLARQERQGALRIGLTLATLLLVGLLGQRVLRNVYLGIETLHWRARRLRERDDNARARFQPRGELGEVLETFERLRHDVLASESQLGAQLAGTEAMRHALARRETFLRSLLDAAQVAIMAIDTDGRWTVFNPAAEQLLGWRADEVVGRIAQYRNDAGEDAPALVSPEQGDLTVARLREKLGRHVPDDWRALYALADLRRPPSETTLLHRDGHHVPVLLALSPIDDPVDGRTGLIAVAADMTQTKRLEAELRDSEARSNAANQAKSAFLAAMSHEIRTPMIGVTGMLEVLAHSRLDRDQRHALNVIQQSAQSLLQVVGDILDFSKIEAGRLDLVAVPTDLGRLLRGTVANFSGAASSKGLRLTVSIDPRVAPAHLADPMRLRQVVANCVSNAIKFTAKGGVEVALEWEGAGSDAADRLCFRVTDTGIGIDPARQERLFQPFTQAEDDTSRHYGGTGLGLAISRHLAELMGGRLALESTPGQGTTLRLHVELPLADPASVAPEASLPGGAPTLLARALPTVPEARADGTLVLLVDDHPTNRLVIGRQLALAGFASEAAADGSEGLAMWREGGYGLVLSDVHMPGLDGYALARAIRAVEARTGQARTPIVALTAAALKGEADRCLAAGMDDYLAKPVPVATLAECLQRWLPQAVPDPARGGAQVTVLPQLGQSPLLDPTVLAALSGGDPAAGRQVLADFVATTDEDLAGLHAARDAGDAVATARQAHRIKGAARLVGAVELAACADALESAARAADWDAVLPLVADLSTAAERLRLSIDAIG